MNGWKRRAWQRRPPCPQSWAGTLPAFKLSARTRMPTSSPPGPSADFLFAAWLARHESGEAADFEAPCRVNPGHAERLRALHAHRHLARRGRLARCEGDEPSPPETDEPLLARLDAASVQGRVALGPNSGRPGARHGHRRDVQPLFIPGELCCDVDGFSLQAKVVVEAHDRERLECLCRYVARPPIATERLSLAPDGRVVYRLRRGSPSKRPTGSFRSPIRGSGAYRRDGTAAVAFDPLTFIHPVLGGTGSTSALPPAHLPRRPGTRRAVA